MTAHQAHAAPVETTGGWVQRFNATERAVHWSYAALFLLLLATGLVLWVPALGAIGRRDVFRQVHILAGLALVAVPLAIALTGDRRSIRRTVAELERLDRADGAFFLRRGTVGRFNAGQKLNSIWTATAALLFLVSGVAMWQWTHVPPTWRTGSSKLHDLLTVASAVILVGHVHLSALHRATRHSMRGMIGGHVRREWAAAHHPEWLAEGDEHPDPPPAPKTT